MPCRRANCSGAATAWRFRPAASPICIAIRVPASAVVADGEIRVDTDGHSNTYRIGEAWFESGPIPVFAQAGSMPTRFIRVMILPRALIGKSSIQYVNEDDKTKPKLQQYRVFVDTPLMRRA